MFLRAHGLASKGPIDIFFRDYSLPQHRIVTQGHSDHSFIDQAGETSCQAFHKICSFTPVFMIPDASYPSSLFFLAEHLCPYSFPANFQGDSRMGCFPRAPFFAVPKDQYKDSFELNVSVINHNGKV